MRSASSASSLRCGTLTVAASAAMCRPCAWRASRRMLPAVRADVASGVISLIELAPFEGAGFGRAREAVLQLAAVVLHALAVAKPVFDARGEPQGLCVLHVGVAVD